MDIEGLVAATQSQLSMAADPAKAGPMAAYLKTDMPFYGVQKAGRTRILRMLKREYPPTDALAYRTAVLALWQLPHREEKYLAIGYARSFGEYIRPDAMAMYQQLITEGAWWDFVDEVASQLVGSVLLAHRGEIESLVHSWILDDDMWLRRTSIICQLKHKANTDTELLDDACTQNLADREFFIRKAIGWALREHSKTDPVWVQDYVDRHRDELSGLSLREASKYL